MERAGAEVFTILRQSFPLAKRVLIVCGKGNNGGDGYVIARLAAKAGLIVNVMVNAPENVIQGDAKVALDKLLENDHEKLSANFYSTTAKAIVQVNQYQGDVIVDCLFGVGFKGKLSKPNSDLINLINQKDCYRISVDVPSGLNADLGLVGTTAVNADVTVTLIAYKQGLLTGQAANYVGKLHLASFNINRAFSQLAATQCFMQDVDHIPRLIKRKPASHKGNTGMLVAIGGYQHYAGAIRLSAEAALRSGAGLVSVCCHENSTTTLLINRPELMLVATSALLLENSPLMLKAKVMVLGPGLGLTTWSASLYRLAIEQPQPKVIDADALRMLAKQPRFSQHWILTPHPGEAAALLACRIEDIEADRFAAVSRIALKYGGVCVLKGSGSLISDGKVTWINTSGNAGMASGGMGDVLSGIIGALILQTPDLLTAARLGVYIHGCAGDNIAHKCGQIGMLASDLYPEIQRLINRI
jgi:NAD(P)H-hydrate epimerase